MASNNPHQDGGQSAKSRGWTMRTRRGRCDSDKISEMEDKEADLKYAVCTAIPSRTRPSLSGAFENNSPKTKQSAKPPLQQPTRDQNKSDTKKSDVG